MAKEGKTMAAKDKATTAEGESWQSSEAYFEKVLDDKRTLKACVATSPDGRQFVSVREWRSRQDGTPYYTKNNLLVPIDDDAMRDSLIEALQAAVPAPKKAPAKKAAKKAK